MRRIAGVDVAYDEAAKRVYAAVVVLDPDTLQVLERVSATLPETTRAAYAEAIRLRAQAALGGWRCGSRRKPALTQF